MTSDGLDNSILVDGYDVSVSVTYLYKVASIRLSTKNYSVTPRVPYDGIIFALGIFNLAQIFNYQILC